MYSIYIVNYHSWLYDYNSYEASRFIKQVLVKIVTIAVTILNKPIDYVQLWAQLNSYTLAL